MNKFWLILFFCQFLASCGSFGESFLAGLTNMGGGYGVYGVGIGATAYTNTSYTTGGNINQLLDPNLAVQQVLAQEDQDYQAFCRFNKKADGSNYSKTEWRIMQGQAIQNANGGGVPTVQVHRLTLAEAPVLLHIQTGARKQALWTLPIVRVLEFVKGAMGINVIGIALLEMGIGLILASLVMELASVQAVMELDTNKFISHFYICKGKL